MGLRLERSSVRKGMRDWRNRLGGIIRRTTVDLGPWLQRSLEEARDEIVNRTLNDQKDTHGQGFRPLAESTVEKKRRMGLNPTWILHETGDMTHVRSFRITKGRTRASLIHLAPAGSHTRYLTGRVTRKGNPRSRRYDYGLAHQHSKRARLPQRKWFLEPGSVMFGLWMKKIAHSLKDWAWRGTRWT